MQGLASIDSAGDIAGPDVGEACSSTSQVEVNPGWRTQQFIGYRDTVLQANRCIAACYRGPRGCQAIGRTQGLRMLHGQGTAGDRCRTRIAVAARQGNRATAAGGQTTTARNLTADQQRTTNRIQTQRLTVGIDRAADSEWTARRTGKATVSAQFHRNRKRATRTVGRHRTIQDKLIAA